MPKSFLHGFEKSTRARKNLLRLVLSSDIPVIESHDDRAISNRKGEGEIMAKQAFENRGSSTFKVVPEDLILVTDPAHELFDERALLPFDEGLVKSIMTIGIREPVLVRKIPGGEAEVVDGRRRVTAAIEANKRLTAAGEPPITVPVLTQGDDASVLQSVMVATNAIRKDDSPMQKARKAQAMLARGVAKANVAIAFGVDEQTVARWIRVMDGACPAVLKAVESERIGMAAAEVIAREAGAEAQQKLLEAAIAEGGSARAAKEHKAGKKGVAARRQKPAASVVRKITKWSEECNDVGLEVKMLLGWITGSVTTQEACASLSWLGALVEKASQKEPPKKRGRKPKAKPELTVTEPSNVEPSVESAAA